MESMVAASALSFKALSTVLPGPWIPQTSTLSVFINNTSSTLSDQYIFASVPQPLGLFGYNPVVSHDL